MFNGHAKNTSPLFVKKNSKRRRFKPRKYENTSFRVKDNLDTLSEKADFDNFNADDFDIDGFMAREIDELTSPKLKPFKSSKSIYSSKPSKAKKPRFSLFPQTMLSSNSILKKTSEAATGDVEQTKEEDINSYMLPSEDTYKSYDIPHHANKRFSDFGSLVGYGRNRRQGPPKHHGNARSSSVNHKNRNAARGKTNSPLGFSTSKSVPIPNGRSHPAQRYSHQATGGSSIKRQHAPWPSRKVISGPI